MRIMIFGAFTSTHSAKWANSLVEKGHDVMLVSYPVELKDNIKYDVRVELYALKFKGSIGYYLNVPEVKKLIKRYQPDVINVHYASGFGTLCRLAKVRPLVISCYGSDVYTYPFLNKFNMYNIRKNLNYANAIACTSYAMADQTRFVLGKPNQEIVITPFGVNTDRFTSVPVKRESDRPIIGIIKYLEPIYDIPLLINAFSLLHKDSDIKPILKIYGDGRLKEELVELSKQLNIEDDVHFMGLIPNSDVPKAVCGMDIFVNCSQKESFGVNMVEAMACKTPVVATKTAGALEVIEQNVTGIVLEDRAPETMALAFKKLLSDRNNLDKMGEAGRERVLRLYDWSKNVQIMEDLYKSLCNTK